MLGGDHLKASPVARFLRGIGSAGPPALLVVVLLVALVWGRRLPGEGALTLPVGVPGGATRAVLVVHPDDCPTNWRFLELLGNPAIGRRIRVVRIAPPTDGAVERLRSRLPEELRQIPIQHLTVDDRRALGRLGYRSGPLLLLFDDDARLRAIEPAPSHPREFVALGRRLQGRSFGDPAVVPN